MVGVQEGQDEDEDDEGKDLADKGKRDPLLHSKHLWRLERQRSGIVSNTKDARSRIMMVIGDGDR